jgi:hypothetical protein
VSKTLNAVLRSRKDIFVTATVASGPWHLPSGADPRKDFRRRLSRLWEKSIGLKLYWRLQERERERRKTVRTGRKAERDDKDDDPT